MKYIKALLTIGVKLIPFTKELHQVLRNEGYTHIMEWGNIQEKDYLKDSGLTGIALYPNSFCTSDDSGKMIRLVDDYSMAEYINLRSFELIEKYYPTGGTTSYLMLDTKNSSINRLLYRKLKKGPYKKQLKQNRHY